MKTYKLLAGILLVIMACSATSTIGYTPDGEGFVESLLMVDSNKFNGIPLGSPLNFYIVVHNYTNDTINNITITQDIPEDVDIITIGDQEITSQELNLTDVTVEDDLTPRTLHFTYINVTNGFADTAGNFTANLDLSLAENESFRLKLSLNFTTNGAFPIDAPEVSYYDHWGDRYTNSVSQGTSVTLEVVTEDERRQYIPEFQTTEPDYYLIIGGILAIFVVAILGRILHFKKPIEL